jgi:hypothetical protein
LKGIPPSSLKNEGIPVPNSTLMRIVYKDNVSGESKWKLLRKIEAISFAKEMGLDLVLGTKVLVIETSCSVNKPHNCFQWMRREILLFASWRTSVSSL